MISVTFNGNPAFLLDDAPDWATPLTLAATMPASYERSLTGKETRRQTGDTLRLELKFTSYVNGDAALTTLRNSLQALNVQPVLCPFWPGGFAAGTLPAITASWYVLLDGASAPSIQPASALGTGFARFAYPLMVGMLAEIPDVPLDCMTGAAVAWHFKENDTTLLTPPTFAAPAGLAATGAVRPLFPFGPDWTSRPTSLAAEVDITRDQIGATRPLASFYYTQPSRRRIQQGFTLLAVDALNLLSFFVTVGGESKSFWLPAGLIEAGLTASVLTTDTTLTVDNGAALGNNGFIILKSPTAAVPLAVIGVAGNTWTLSGAVGTAFNAGLTTVESLVLARFDTLKLELNFVSPTLAAATVKFKELPWEMAAAAGETLGTTMGALPTTAMLYVFTLTTPGANTVSYFTNFERNLTDGDGNVYTSAPMENDKITESASLERQNVTIKARNFAGNPLALLVPFQLEWPLELAIYEADVTGNAAGNLRCYFSGEISDVSLDGPILTANAASLNWMFDRSAARRLFQQNDNFVLFETANGLAPADWQWSAVVVSYAVPSATLVVGTITSTNSTTTVAHFFAAGYLALTHAGAATQYRMIADSSAVTAGQITLHLSSPLATAPSVGDAVLLYPGYDGQYETALNTFANGDNFGGFPWIPVGNPFVLKISQPTGGGKK